jgi:hypothetical protein
LKHAFIALELERNEDKRSSRHVTDSGRRISTAKSKRHAVTVLLTEDHLRMMIDDRLLKEEEIDDRVKLARAVQKLLNGALGPPESPWHDWDDWAKGLE